MGGLVDILIETDTASRICIADHESIGNVDRSTGAVLKGQCSSDGRLHACFNADTRRSDQTEDQDTLEDLRFYVWCDENCQDTYDTDMMIRTSKSEVKWNKLDDEGTFSS